MHIPTILLLLAIGLNQFAEAQNRVVIAVSAALDGKGKVLLDTRSVVSGSKIVAIDPKVSPIDYDLRGLTVMPGWIDAHVHITSSFGPDRRLGFCPFPTGPTPTSREHRETTPLIPVLVACRQVPHLADAA